jgi:hypothetical protein
MAIISPLKKIFNWQTASDKIPYRVYTAILTQTGTDAPVANVLENTVGNINWIYDGTGIYKLNFGTNLPSDKVFIPGSSNYNGFNATIIPFSNGNAIFAYMQIYPNTVGGPGGGFCDGIYIDLRDDTFSFTEWSNILGPTGVYFEIRVYN